MTRRVHSVTPACTLDQAAAIMARARVSCIVVADGSRPVGILTDRDLVRLIHLRTAGATSVALLMSQPVLTADPDLDFRAAYALLKQHAVRHLLVIDEGAGTALGVVTLTDFLSHIGADFFRKVKSLRAITEPVLATLPPSASLAQGLQFMVQLKSDLILITEHSEPVGILTEGDMARLLSDHPDPDAIALRSVMSAPLHSIDPEATVAEAVHLLAANSIRHLPVVNAQRQVLGVVNQSRLLEKLGIELFDEAWRRSTELDATRQRLENDLQMVMEATGSGTWEYDHVNDSHTWSPSMAALLGCAYEELPGSLDGWLAMIHTEDVAAFEREIEASAARGDQIVEAEYRVRQTGGNWLWLHERVRVLERDAGGQPLRTVGILQDITARKRADRRLDQERQNLRQLFDTMEDYLFVVGHDSLILHINQAVFRLGYGADLIGKSIFSVHPPEYAEESQRMFEEVRAGTRRQCPIPLIKADGGRIAVDTRAVCGEWDGVPAIIGVSRDIRVQIAQREALETERRRLQTLIRSIPDPVWIKDLEGRYLACNAVFERMYGASEDEIRGKTDFDFVDEATARHFRHNDRAAAEAQAPLINEEWLDFKQDGYRGLFETIKTPTLDAQGQLIGVLGIARDITAARQAQEALKEREEIYSAIVNQAVDGIVLIDTETLRFAEFNDAACQGLGYCRDEFSAMTLVEVQADDSRERVTDKMGLLLSGALPMVFEVRHRSKSGQLRDMRVSNRVLDIRGHTYLAAIWQDITEQKQAARALQEAHMFLKATQSIARVGGWKANPLADTVLWTDEVFRLLERPVSQPPKTLEEGLTYYAPAILPEVRRNLMTAWETGAPFTMECEMVAQSGRHFIAELRCVGRVEEPGGSFLTGTFQDISERKQLEDQIRLRERYHRAVLDNFPFPVWLKDRESRFLSVNQPFARYFGQPSPESLVGKTDYDIAAREFAEMHVADDRAVLESGVPRNVEEPVENGGRTIWKETYKSPVHMNGQVIGTVGYARDISARKEAEARVAFLANHDPLTSLPNRTLAKDRAEQSMNLAERSGSKTALLFLDVDNFKTINDSLGHPVGDALLQEVAARLRGCVRDTDTISRQGGDEFLILLSDVRDAESIEGVLDKILSRLAIPIRVEGHELSMTMSIGVAIFPDDGRDFDTLFRRADTAMYRAKEAGRNTYRFFCPPDECGSHGTPAHPHPSAPRPD